MNNSQIMKVTIADSFTMIHRELYYWYRKFCLYYHIRAVVGGSMILFLDNNVWRIND